uniref:Uncharacterized protein n=1 Tax=Romanomermis culicivorax TaxID=13658 RepID=A0A915IN66_ROMCU
MALSAPLRAADPMFGFRGGGVPPLITKFKTSMCSYEALYTWLGPTKKSVQMDWFDNGNLIGGTFKCMYKCLKPKLATDH